MFIVKVLDMLCVDENDMIYKEREDELFGGWRNYICEIKLGSIDDIDFVYEDVDKSVFIIEDGGELIRLKNGKYVNICWRFSMCRVWYEDDEDMIKFYNEKLNKK